MRKILAVVVVLAGACVSVDATRIRTGLYVVSVRGNAIGGQGEAIAAANTRASELCPNGYEIQDSAAGSTSAYLRTTYGYQQIRKPEITMVVRCDQPEPAPPPPAPRQPSTANAAVARWWCATFLGGRQGACFRSQSWCERSRESALKIDSAVSSCAPASTAMCFGVAYPGQEGSDDMCHPNRATCVIQRAYALGHPEMASVLTECRPID
jgi:hypothetical protein